MINLKEFEAWFVTGSQHLYLHLPSGTKQRESAWGSYAESLRFDWRRTTVAGNTPLVHWRQG